MDSSLYFTGIFFYCHFNFWPNLNGTFFSPCPEALLELVRDELGFEAAEELVPMVKGGVQLHKIFGVMHDTCHTANRVARLMVELREAKARMYHGDDVWDVSEYRCYGLTTQ